jgi:hypothetical protein
MSWDVLIQDFGDYKQISDIPNDFQPKSIGNKSDIIAKIKETFPDVRISDSSWLILEYETFSIEFNIGDGDKVDSMMLHVRSDESGTINELLGLFETLNVRAVDTSTGEFIENKQNIKKGLLQWKEFRDSILKRK